MMQLGGCQVCIAPDGASAINLFDNEYPDLVLLDIMMLGMDGYAVCKRIR
ncbi:MAG: response regulator [Dehalococcoidia bacterium]|nr:response regulator [Dehalococcoidia bacterium]